MSNYQYRYENGHVVVLKNGKFWGSFDTKGEAYREVIGDYAESRKGES